MKKLFLSLLFVLVLVIGAALIVPAFVNWNSYKPEIAAQVEKLTGRALTIEGDIALQLLPTPALRAEGISLANLDAGSTPQMLTLEALEVSLQLRALLALEWKVSGITLVKPRVLLEVLPDGRVNWALGPQRLSRREQQAQPFSATLAQQIIPIQQPAAPPPLAITLDRVKIEDGSLVFFDRRSGARAQIGQLAAILSADTLQGPFAGEGRGQFRGAEFTFAGKVGQLPMAIPLLPGQSSTSSPLQLKLGLPAAGSARLTFVGALQRALQGDLLLAGKLTGDGDNLAQVIAVAQPSADLPPLLAQPFSLESKIGYDVRRVAARELELRLGQNQITGSIEAALGARPALSLALASPQLDLDDLLGRGAAGAAAGGGGGAARQSGLADLVLPRAFDADVVLTVAALRYRRQVVRQLQFDGTLAGGQLTVNRATALLPGGADLSVIGQITTDQGGSRFTGRLESSANNLRALLAWFDLPVAQVPGDRLRRFSVSARLQADAKLAAFQDLDLELDTTRITGAATVALRRRPGIGIGLAIDRLNLDAYLPKTGSQGGGGGQASAPGGAVVAVMERLDANVKLVIGELTLQGQQIKDLSIDGRLQDGQLLVRQSAFRGFGGGSITFAGQLSGLPEQPRLQEGELTARYADSRRLAQVLGLASTSALARLGPLRLDGRLAGDVNGLDYNITGQLLGGDVTTSGRVLDYRSEPRVDGGRLSVAQITGAQLQRLLALPKESAVARLGPLTLTSRFSGGAQTLSYDTQLAALGGELQIEGTAEGLLDLLPKFDLRLAVNHPQPDRLLTALAGKSALSAQAGPLRINSRVTGSLLRFTASEIAATLGPSQIEGEIKTSLLGPRPEIRADLTVGQLPLDLLLAESGGGGGQAVDSRWSRNPFDQRALQRVDGQLAVSVATLTSGGLQLDDLVVEARLKAGVLELRQMTAGLYGGRLSATGRVDGASGKIFESDLDLRIEQAQTLPMLTGLTGFKRIEGPLSVTARLRGSGISQAELISRLNGQGTLDGGLQARFTQQEKAGAAILTLLGSRVKEVRGVTDTLGTLYQAFGNKPARLQGGFEVTKGVVRPRDLMLVGQNDSQAVVSGVLADLPRWGMDALITLRRQGVEQPDLQIGLRGPLDRPNPRIKDLRVQRNDSSLDAPASPTQESPTQESPTQESPAQAPARLDKINPEDMLRGLLKELRKP